MSEKSELRLFFIDTALFEDGAVVRGGLLVSDIDTKPL